MQLIRNKRLQKYYIDFAVASFNILTTKYSQNLKLFNYFTLERYKYYLTRRANNIL